MSEARAERMNPVDEAWFQMDQPRSPMVVAALMEFDGVADLAGFATALASRLLSQPRFRQRVVAAGGHHAWLEEAQPNVAYHLRERVLSDPGSDAELRRAVAHELQLPLDKALPLWRVTLFPRGDRRVAALFRAHHAIADGIAFLQLLLGLADGGAGPAHAVAAATARHGPLASLIGGLEAVNGALESVAGLVADDLRHPGQISRQVGSARRTLGTIARVLALPDDNPPRLRARIGGRRAVAWDDNLSLAAFKRIAKMQHVTVNDVFLTALAGAFRAALLAGGSPVPEPQNLRVSVPVNLRAAAGAAGGNQFGLVLVDLPIGLEGWPARLDVIADRMRALKESGEARAVLLALGAAGHLPVSVEKRLVEVVSGKAAAVVSNLPGPRRVLALAGARVGRITFWPPQAGDLGIGVGLLSYAGRISIGVSADIEQLAEPQKLLDGFCAELRAMLGRNPHHRAAKGSRRESPAAARPSTGEPHALT